MPQYLTDGASGVIIRRPNQVPRRTDLAETVVRELMLGDTHPRAVQNKYGMGKAGGIYNTFAGLEARGVAESRIAPGPVGRNARPLRVFTITDYGRQLAEVWGLGGGGR